MTSFFIYNIVTVDIPSKAEHLLLGLISMLAVEKDDSASKSFCPSLDGSVQSCSNCVIPSNPPDTPGCSNRLLVPVQ